MKKIRFIFGFQGGDRVLEDSQLIPISTLYCKCSIVEKWNMDLIKTLCLTASKRRRRRVLLLQHKCSEALMTDGGRSESQI